MKGKPILTPEQWGVLRSAYESGAYSSVEDFYKRYITEKVLRGRPTFLTVRDRVTKERWSKHALEPLIKAEQDKLNAERYAKHGLTPDKVARVTAKVIDDIVATNEELLTTIRDLSVQGAEFDMTRLAALVEIAKKYIADKKAAAPYLEQYHKVTGTYAPTRHEMSGTIGTKHVPANMTPEEMVAQAEHDLAIVKAALAHGDAPWKKQPPK